MDLCSYTWCYCQLYWTNLAYSCYHWRKSLVSSYVCSSIIYSQTFTPTWKTYLLVEISSISLWRMAQVIVMGTFQCCFFLHPSTSSFPSSIIFVDTRLKYLWRRSDFIGLLSFIDWYCFSSGCWHHYFEPLLAQSMTLQYSSWLLWDLESHCLFYCQQD